VVVAVVVAVVVESEVSAVWSCVDITLNALS